MRNYIGVIGSKRELTDFLPVELTDKCAVGTSFRKAKVTSDNSRFLPYINKLSKCET
jgi:hypothetical protein